MDELGSVPKTGSIVAASPTFCVLRTRLCATIRPSKKSSRNDLTTNLRGEKITAEKPAADDAQAEAIIASLKAWRKRKADDLNVPPYIIFGDKTLLDLAAKKPKSRQELLNIYGIGRAKAEEFGRSILQIIEEN